MNDQEIEKDYTIEPTTRHYCGPPVSDEVKITFNSVPTPSPPLLVVTATKNPIHLTIAQGNVIKALITKHCKMNQTEYAAHINMNMALLSKYLSGELPITVQSLQRILSKITYNSPDLQMGFEAEWQTRILVREYTIGPVVPNADCTVLGDQSLLEDNG